MHRKLWNKDFILLLQGSAVSTLGDLMYSVAIGYWVYEQTGSTGLMGLMTSISMFVTMFLSPFCGSIVDKCNRKWIIVGIDVIQGLLMLGIGALAYRDALSVPVVLIAALVASFGSVFYSPAVGTLMLDIIPRDDMLRGQSLFASISSLIEVVGSAFSGAMVAFFGVPLIVVINGISNLYAAMSELFVTVPKTIQQGTKVTVRGVLRDSKSAVATIFSDPLLKLFIPSALILNFLGAGPFSLILPFCLEKGFSVDTYGYLVFAYTVGGLLCVALLGIVKLSPKVSFWVMALGFVGCVPMMTMAYLTKTFPVMCVFAVLGAFLNRAGNSVFGAALKLALPEENRSAILGLMQSASVGGSALSVVVYGLLGDVFPLYLVFAVGNAISIVPMLYLCFHNKMREFILKHSE